MKPDRTDEIVACRKPVFYNTQFRTVTKDNSLRLEKKTVTEE